MFVHDVAVFLLVAGVKGASLMHHSPGSQLGPKVLFVSVPRNLCLLVCKNGQNLSLASNVKSTTTCGYSIFICPRGCKSVSFHRRISCDCLKVIILDGCAQHSNNQCPSPFPCTSDSGSPSFFMTSMEISESRYGLMSVLVYSIQGLHT